MGTYEGTDVFALDGELKREEFENFIKLIMSFDETINELADAITVIANEATEAKFNEEPVTNFQNAYNAMVNTMGLLADDLDVAYTYVSDKEEWSK